MTREEKWKVEQVEWARGTPEDRRRIYKRQWMRRSRKRDSLKDVRGCGVRVYLSQEMLRGIDALRPKGRGRSGVILELVREAIQARASASGHGKR